MNKKIRQSNGHKTVLKSKEKKGRSESPRGLYQEFDEVRVDHQQKFVEIIKNTSPRIIEDLKILTSRFALLFGQSTSDEEINQCLIKVNNLFESLFSATLDFPFTESTYKVDKSFRWKRVRLPLHWARFVFEEKTSTDKSKLPTVTEEIKIWAGESPNYDNSRRSVEKIEKAILNSFQNTKFSNEQILRNFFDLQSELFLWMEDYHLEKDWLLQNAYIFLCQLSHDSTTLVRDLKVLRRVTDRRLQADDFIFEAEGWWAREETAKEYQKRILYEVKAKLSEYIELNYSSLNLDLKKQITKPKDPNFESIYWLIAWNEGATLRQIGDTFDKHPDDVKDRINALKQFDLPKRVDKPGRKKELPVNAQRMQEIKQVFEKQKT